MLILGAGIHGKALFSCSIAYRSEQTRQLVAEAKIGSLVGERCRQRVVLHSQRSEICKWLVGDWDVSGDNRGL